MISICLVGCFVRYLIVVLSRLVVVCGCLGFERLKCFVIVLFWAFMGLCWGFADSSLFWFVKCCSVYCYYGLIVGDIAWGFIFLFRCYFCLSLLSI